MIRIRLSRLPHGEGLPLPSYATLGAAGMDVVAAEDLDLMPGQRHAVATGFKVAIPCGDKVPVRVTVTQPGDAAPVDTPFTHEDGRAVFDVTVSALLLARISFS